jgi:hypothetical protein
MPRHRRRKVWEDFVGHLKQRAARSRRSMQVEHRLIDQEASFPEPRPGKRLLEVLQADPFAEPGFDLTRAHDRGRRVEL